MFLSTDMTIHSHDHDSKHEIAKRIILLTLPNHDRAYVCGSLTLHEIWSKLLAKYMPSMDAKARKLWSRFSALRQAGRPLVEHVNSCMTVKNLLEAIGETVPDKQFVDKLLNVDRELSYLRPVLARAPIAEIVAVPTELPLPRPPVPESLRQRRKRLLPAPTPTRARCTCYRSGTSSNGRGERCIRGRGASVLQLRQDWAPS